MKIKMTKATEKLRKSINAMSEAEFLAVLKKDNARFLELAGIILEREAQIKSKEVGK